MGDWKPSPRIVALSWGHMEIEGLGVGKDYKLYPGGGRPWDWTETGTDHVPGIQPADVQELLANGATTVILSQGMEGELGVDPATTQMLEAISIVVHVARTAEAAALYNELVDSVPVGGLFHSTC
jgi:hypothetical protein